MTKKEMKVVYIGEVPKVDDKELEKWTKILGAKEMIWLYVENKIVLTAKQLDMVIKIKNGYEERINRVGVAK